MVHGWPLSGWRCTTWSDSPCSPGPLRPVSTPMPLADYSHLLCSGGSSYSALLSASWSSFPNSFANLHVLPNLHHSTCICLVCLIVLSNSLFLTLSLVSFHSLLSLVVSHLLCTNSILLLNHNCFRNHLLSLIILISLLLFCLLIPI